MYKYFNHSLEYLDHVCVAVKGNVLKGIIQDTSTPEHLLIQFEDGSALRLPPADITLDFDRHAFSEEWLKQIGATHLGLIGADEIVPVRRNKVGHWITYQNNRWQGSFDVGFTLRVRTIDHVKETPKRVTPMPYLKLYVAILDDVPDFMAVTLGLHSILSADDCFKAKDNNCETKDYLNWRQNSFRKVTVRLKQDEFAKLIREQDCYLGHENTTLGGKKSCAVVYPVWSNKVPDILKKAPLWSPKEA